MVNATSNKEQIDKITVTEKKNGKKEVDRL